MRAAPATPPATPLPTIATHSPTRRPPGTDQDSCHRGGGKTWALRAAATFVLFLTATGCADAPEAPAAAHTVGERSSEFSSAGIERVVPIRFIALSEFNPAVKNLSVDDLNLTIERANRAFRTSGVQFYMRSYEAFSTQTLYYASSTAGSGAPIDNLSKCWDAANCSTAASSCPTGGNVWQDAVPMYPSLTRYSVPACASRKASGWLDYLSAVWSEKGSINVWISNYAGNFSCGPNQCKQVFMYYGDFTWRSNVFAHELGHYFGIAHTEIAELSFDAATGGIAGMDGAWDLVYFPGTSSSVPHKYFTSETQAAAYLSSTNSLGEGLSVIDRLQGGDCSVTSTTTPGTNSGQIACYVRTSNSASYVEVQLHGSAALQKRMAFTTNAPDNPPYSYRWGTNVMSYADIGRDLPDSFSESQALLVRKALRYEANISSPSYGTVAGARTYLGDSVASSNQFFLDVDGDGRRDLATWTPPDVSGALGTFKVALSGQSWSQAPASSLTFQIGINGDTPFVGDLNGDGAADIIMYEPGYGGTGAPTDASRWIYCLTNKTNVLATSCHQTTALSVAMGTQQSAPIGPLVMSNAAGAGAAFVTWESKLSAWRSRGITGAETFYSMAAGPDYRGAVPLPGQYDGDAANDLAVYIPATAKVHGILSSLTWNPSLQRTESFSGVFIASASGGTPYGRSGGVPVRNVYSRAGSLSPRMGLALWQPEMNQWEAHFDAFSASPKVLPATCTAGNRGDIPFGGLDISWLPGTYSQESFTSLSLYRGGAWATSPLTPGNGYVLRYPLAPVATTSTTPLACPTTNTTANQGGTPSRWLVFPVADMNSDGYAEIVQINPDTGVVYVYGSNSGYSTSIMSFVMADSRAVFL